LPISRLDLGLVHQQLLGADLVRVDVGGGAVQRVDLAADQEQLAIADDHIAVGQLHLALAQRLDLPAFQHDAGLEALLEEIIEGGLLVVGDAGFGRGSVGFLEPWCKVGLSGASARPRKRPVYNPAQPCIL
jgi:hypothetical protein